MTIQVKQMDTELRARGLEMVLGQRNRRAAGTEIPTERWERNIGVALAMGNRPELVAELAGMTEPELRKLADRLGVVGLD